MRRFELLRSPRFWLGSLLLWAVVLYSLSSFSKPVPEGGPEIPHIDKVLHFGYFFGGGVIFATCILLWKGIDAKRAVRLFIPLAILACVGALDEYHQTFTPGRSGNDPLDWLADVLGSATGLVLAGRLHPLLLKVTSAVSR